MNQIVFNNPIDLLDDEPDQRGGDRSGKNQARIGALFHVKLLHNGYFTKNFVLGFITFHEVFHMCKRLFMRLRDAICSIDNYFE